ncbi:hypothetical protein DLREEDagr8_25290 [Dongia sp. agr-C8]
MLLLACLMLVPPATAQDIHEAANALPTTSGTGDTLPADPGIWRLKGAIALYRDLAAKGGWPTLTSGPKLARGDSGPRVEALRSRLAATDDLAAAELQRDDFDPVLEQAVQAFQARHGLQTDGVVGPKTLAALNVPVQQRLDTMLANLGRLQRQNRDWGWRYIAVNIAAATYRLVIDGHTALERPAVVGKPSWPTPTLDSVIDRIEFHPYWRIPTSIADGEVWPKQEADPGYFAQQGIRIVGSGLVQDPGPRNPLGAVKFVFDNPYSVYLHDTSAPGLFARAYRFLSHGCVRVSDAAALARALLAPDPQWPEARVESAIAGGANQDVVLRAPIPLHIVYDTAWVMEEGTIQFRDDVYHRDFVPPSSLPMSAVEPDAQVAGLGARPGGCRG